MLFVIMFGAMAPYDVPWLLQLQLEIQNAVTQLIEVPEFRHLKGFFASKPQEKRIWSMLACMLAKHENELLRKSIDFARSKGCDCELPMWDGFICRVPPNDNNADAEEVVQSLQSFTGFPMSIKRFRHGSEDSIRPRLLRMCDKYHDVMRDAMTEPFGSFNCLFDVLKVGAPTSDYLPPPCEGPWSIAKFNSWAESVSAKCATPRPKFTRVEAVENANSTYAGYCCDSF